jgi:hypothetical protein
MAYTSTETQLSVLAGDPSHTGVLGINTARMQPVQMHARGGEPPPPYDYEGDAIAIAKFLEKFLPAETWTQLKFRFRVGKT